MQAEIKRFEDKEALCQTVCADFAALYRQAVVEQGCFNVALSGGTTPKRLYELLASSCKLGDAWQGTGFYFGDERHVSASHPDSNYRMVNTALFEPCHIEPERVFRMETGLAAEAAAHDYASRLEETLPLRDKLPVFDLVLLGMGADGHTASLFSLASLLDEETVIASYVDKLEAWRISINFNVINNARHVWVLVAGADKAERLAQVLGGKGTDLPIGALQPRGELRWYVDAAAAAAIPVTDS